MGWRQVGRIAVGCAVLTVCGFVAACGGGGSACAECLDEKCSDLVESTCEGDADCMCMVDCVGAEGIPGVESCLTTCGLTERPPAFIAIEECTAVACPDSGDECATPDDWEPPGNDVMCEGSAAGIGGGALADCSFDTNVPFDPDGAVLQLLSADQTVCARIVRRDDGAGSLANTQWTLLESWIGPLGEVAHVDAAADQCYYAGHHNFRDWVHVWTGTRHFDLMLHENGHDGTRTYELYVFEQGEVDAGACAPTAEGTMCIEGPIELFGYDP